MPSHRPIRTKGKTSLSRYFQKFEKGDSVAIVKDSGTNASFSQRLQGRTGVISGKRGSAYIVEVRELGMKKQIIAHPIHLKKITVAA